MQKDSLYSELENELKKNISGEVRFDKLSRLLYSTDASNYRIEPIGLVIPKNVEDIIATVEVTARYDVPILPRGGGTSLTGQSVGHAVVIDFSKYMSKVLEVDIDNKSVRVQPGIYLDDLNRELKEHGLTFGPDPSSSKAATIGGVVGNNATGAHSVIYGMAGDNVVASRALTAGGEIIDLHSVTDKELSEITKGNSSASALYGKLDGFRKKYSDIVKREFPKHWRRASGYSLNYFLDKSFNPARLLAGSEGTLAIQTEYTLKLEPLEEITGLAVLQFSDFREAMECVPTILEHKPSAIELIDGVLIGLTREQPGFSRILTFVEDSPEAILAVEFNGDSQKGAEKKARELISILRKKRIRFQGSTAASKEAQANVWNVRKAGLGLLASKRGDYKPIACIEDVSVPVDKLSEYAGGIKELTDKLGTNTAFYGHASAGCLHVRPFVNLKSEDGLKKMEELTEGALNLTEKLGGVMSGEHGDGLQRSHLNERLFGEELYGAMTELKHIFDPEGRLNPGKVVEPASPAENLRYGPSYKTREIKTYLDWSADYGLDGAAEMCNGQGVCRKTGDGIMCPSYRATRDERDSTRARANALREMLSGNLPAEDLTSEQMKEVYDLCISCKACKTECPSSVDAAKMKLEFLAHFNEKHGLSLRKRLFGGIHDISRFSARLPGISGFLTDNILTRFMMSGIGISHKRSLPKVSGENFVRWFKGRKKKNLSNGKKAVYFHDTWSTYYEPEVGKAAVRLLEAAGYDVILEDRRVCCGRPMISEGMAEQARKLAWRNVSALLPYVNKGIPIIGTEPSCVLSFREEYPWLLPDDDCARALADNSFVLTEFLNRLNKDEKLGINWKNDGPGVLYHGHCHERSLVGDQAALELLKLSGCRAEPSGAGCCGMAGSFGYESEHYSVSKAIGEDRLFPKVKQAEYNKVIAVSGFSCAHQIEHFTGRTPKHISQVLADQIADT